jgi:hypothetical protein
MRVYRDPAALSSWQSHCRECTTMGKERDDYASYLLRLRRSDRNGQPTWRASLESTRDGERLEFSSVEALLAYLDTQFGQAEWDVKSETDER